MKKRLLSMFLASAMVLTSCGGGGGAETTTGDSSGGTTPTPSGKTETVKIICPYGVGGTADAIARKYALVAGELYPEYNFIVENMTGGDGFAAATYFSELPDDTKELLVYGYGVAYRHDIGTKYGTEIVDFDRSSIYPVASIDDRTWIMYAKPDTTLEQVIEKSKNGGIKMSGGNPLSDPHLALGSLIAREGGTVTVVSYDGGASQKKGLTDGEVDVFVGTTQAGQEEVEAGTLVPILAFSENAFEGFISPTGPITVSSIAGDSKDPALSASIDHTGSILRAGGFIATKSGADEEWVNKIIDVSKAVWAAPEYNTWIDEILLNRFEVYGEDAKNELENACKKALEAFADLS